MKKNNLYKAIKITLIFLLVILIVLSFLVGRGVMKKDSDIPTYSTVEDMPDINALINQMYGKFIKIEDSQVDGFYKDIYVELKYGLYENGESEKDFYSSLTTNVAKKMNYENVRVIDEEKSIELKIVCDKENATVAGTMINDDTDFFGHYESQLALSNYKKANVTNFNIQSVELNTLLQNNWDKDSLNIENSNSFYDEYDKYTRYVDYGISIYEIDEKVFNILLDSDYKAEVLNGIKVGETLENVVKVLGTPTFGSVDYGYVGYKNENIYVFFNNRDEISIYPVEGKDDNLSKLIEDYQNDGSVKKLISGATDLWENYQTYYYNEYTVYLKYPLKGINFEYNAGENDGIIVYSNYIGKLFNNCTQEELSKMEIEIPSCIYFTPKDSVNEFEKERYDMLIYSEYPDEEDSNDLKYE